MGSGPFPSEDTGVVGDRLRSVGNEFGTVTGRPRRCGWIDIPLLKKAIRINGVDSVLLTKLDVLSGLETIKIATNYQTNGKVSADLDWDIDLETVDVVYEEMPGWSEDISAARSLADLPAAARNYIQRVAALIDCPISGFSVGPDRDQTIICSEQVRNIFNLAQ